MSNINDSVTNAESPALNLSFNLIYFDAFAPEKQPEMWSQELFNRLYVLLDRDGILTNLLRQRCRPPDVTDSRIHSRTPARTSGW